MRGNSIVLSCLIAVLLIIAPSTSRAQRIVYGGCLSRSFSCSRYDDVETRIERQRARAFERAERSRALAEARAEARVRTRVLTSRAFHDYSRDFRRMEARERARERAFRARTRHYYRW